MKAQHLFGLFLYNVGEKSTATLIVLQETGVTY